MWVTRSVYGSRGAPRTDAVVWRNGRCRRVQRAAGRLVPRLLVLHDQAGRCGRQRRPRIPRRLRVHGALWRLAVEDQPSSPDGAWTQRARQPLGEASRGPDLRPQHGGDRLLAAPAPTRDASTASNAGQAVGTSTRLMLMLWAAASTSATATAASACTTPAEGHLWCLSAAPRCATGTSDRRRAVTTLQPRRGACWYRPRRHSVPLAHLVDSVRVPLDGQV